MIEVDYPIVIYWLSMTLVLVIFIPLLRNRVEKLAILAFAAICIIITTLNHWGCL